jgi:hypothetical protein
MIKIKTKILNLFICLFLLMNISNIHAAEKIGRPVRVVSLSFYGNDISEM